MASYTSTVRLHQLNIPELSGYISEFLTYSSNSGTSGLFSIIGSGRTSVTDSGGLIVIGSDAYNLTTSGDLTNLFNSIITTSNTSYYPYLSGNFLSSEIDALNNFTGNLTGESGMFSFIGNSGILISTNLDDIIISYTGNDWQNYVPLSQFNSGTSTGFNFFYLKDNLKLLSSTFNQGQDFYLQGQESVNISTPYIIDLYGSLATSNSLPSGKPYILGFDVYGGKITSSGNQVLTFADTGYYVSPSQLLSASGSLMSAILRYRAATETGLFSISGSDGINVSGVGNNFIISFTGTASNLPDITDIGGNVGINNLSPQYALDVNGDIGNSIYTSNNFITLDDGYGNLSIKANGNQLFTIHNQTGISIGFGASAVKPNAIAIGNNAFSNGINAIVIGTGTTSNIDNTIIIGNSQKVGINQSSPQYDLDVKGSGNFSSGLYVSGNNISTYFYSTNNPSGYITELNTGSFITTDQSGLFYPKTNPSGYITGINLTSYITTGQTGQFYSINNPSGFITGVNTGNFITTGQTGLFYAASNPSNYITISSLSPYYLNSNPSGFISSESLFTENSGSYYPRSNPSGYITGVNTGNFVTTNNTGLFITTGQTGAFYPSSNPSGYISTETSFAANSGSYYLRSNPSGYITGVDLTSYQQITPVTTTIYVDVNRIDAYVSAGSINYPYKSIGSAITALGAPSGPIILNLAVGTYIEESPTFPTVPIIINGNNSTIVTALGAGTGIATFPSTVVLNNITLLGNLVLSSTSTTVWNNLYNVEALGNFTSSGMVSCINTSLLGNGSTNGVVTISPGSTFEFSSSVIGSPAYYSRLVLGVSSTVFLSTAEVFSNEVSNYAIDASASGSILYANFVKIYNFGAGKGINTSNGAIVNGLNNSLLGVDVYLSGSGNGIVAGSSATLCDAYTIVYGFGGGSPTFGTASGTNILGKNYGSVTATTISANLVTVDISSNVTIAINTLNFVDTTSARSLKMPPPSRGATFYTKDTSFLAQTNPITFTQNGSEKIEGIAGSYLSYSQGGSILWASNGIDWFIIN